ncbi:MULTISPECIES: hypothetical protein [Nostocales]|uniref:Uncharacterized protein n=3 Tax=Nostocales TaxID=1161 RepID=A0A8S9T9D5_9CYAN|nr:hypothetical protein [Tolypothrix bouteillei]KAF3888617.1 hypothetical protein DA73_0400026410 [Tolypothrix bouteillei VB521301]
MISESFISRLCYAFTLRERGKTWGFCPIKLKKIVRTSALEFVETTNEKLKSVLGQFIAEMVAVQLFDKISKNS